MKVLLLGATGRLGKEVLKRLVSEGIPTHVLVRDVRKVKIQSADLQVFEGTPANAADLDRALSGCDTVLTTLNISRKSDFPWSKLRAPKTLLSDTMAQLLELGKSQGLKRILTVSAWGAHESKKDLPFWFRWLIDNSNIKYGYLDHERQEELLQAAELDWMIVRPVGLSNSQKDKDAHASIQSETRGLLVSRKAVAAFMVQHLTLGDFNREVVTLS